MTTADILELLQWRGVGPAVVRRVLAGRRRKETLLDAAARVLPPVSRLEREAAHDRAAKVMARCFRLEVKVVGIEEEGYPARLRQIPDPPPLLFVLGSVDVLHAPSVAVVGTRRASWAGQEAAAEVARRATARGLVVVSGLALGIDGAAHEAALDGGRTVAVLAHGLDTVTPPSHRELAEWIVAGGGALVAEHPPGVPPMAREYVRRDRIQSGLALGSMMIESEVRGGAIHHARFAAAQGRPVWVVQHGTLAGPELIDEGARLLRAEIGAQVVRTPEDVDAALATLEQPAQTALDL